MLLELAMIDKNGVEVKNEACRVAWSLQGTTFAAGASITVGADTRFATVGGQSGDYVVRATTPNGVSVTVGIVLQ